MVIGYTTGVYDMFHIGHLNVIRSAKEQCDYLIVGVSTDELVFHEKNKTPIIPFEERCRIVEAIKYVEAYQPEYYATLLLPAGITSEASIRYKDEGKLLRDAENIDKTYLESVLPAKMQWNLESIKRFHLMKDIITMGRTILAIFGKEYK